MTLRWLGSWQAEYGDDDATKLAPLTSGVFKVNVGRTGVLFSVEVGIDAVANVLDRRRQHPDYATHHDGLKPHVDARCAPPVAGTEGDTESCL